MISRIVAAGLFGLGLSGCGLDPKLFGPALLGQGGSTVQQPAPPRLTAYTTKVYWAKDIEALARDLRAHPRQDIIIYGVSATGYREMQNNWAELYRYIAKQKAIIAYYKNQPRDFRTD